MGFPGSSIGKESACNSGDLGLIPESGRAAGGGIGFPPQYSWASLIGGSAVKESARNAGDLGSIPALGRSPAKGKGYPLQYSGLENSVDCVVHGAAKSQARLTFTFTLTFSVLHFPFSYLSPWFTCSLVKDVPAGGFRASCGSPYLLKYVLSRWCKSKNTLENYFPKVAKNVCHR